MSTTSTRRSSSTSSASSNGEARRVRKLEIAGGQNVAEGFTSIDLGGDAGIVHDLFTFPWPIATSSVREARCSHFVEHIPHELRPGPGVVGGVDGWWQIFDEIYRVLAPGATIEIWHPYAMHVRADWDPTHRRRIHEQTWYYLNAAWREGNGLDHYPVACDFDVLTIDSPNAHEMLTARAPEMAEVARLHYWNVIPDLHVVLASRKPKPARSRKGKS